MHYHCNQGGKRCSSLLSLAVSHTHTGRHDQLEQENTLLLNVNFSLLTEKGEEAQNGHLTIRIRTSKIKTLYLLQALVFMGSVKNLHGV